MNKTLRILAAAVAPVPIVACVTLAGSANASTNPLVAVPQNVNPAIAHSARTANLSGTEQLSFAVALKLRNSADLDSFLTNLSDPASPQYHHFLTPAQFEAKYSPTAGDVAKVSAFLSANGLRVTGVSGNRDVVDVSGSAAAVSRAFHTGFGVYSEGGRQFYANDVAPTLPSDVAGLVQGIAGLDDHAVRHPDAVPAATGKASPSGLNPTQLHNAYETTSLGTGSGQSVALWEFDGYQQSNISKYDSQFSLGSPTPTTVSVDGANYNSSPGDGQGEVELDIEIVQAMAKAAKTFVYEAPNSDQGQIDMAAKIASDDKVSVTSISWGLCETQTASATITSTANEFKQGVAEGITFYSASGDSGSDDCGDGTTAVDYPASDPNVSGVGGTTLRLSGTSRSSETAWSGSGGGVSAVFSTPSWQKGSNGKRTVPDVSADADPNTGYAIFSAGSWAVFGGTSCAAPMWSGFTALHDASANSKAGNINPKLYSIAAGSGYASDFHDITSGSNGSFRAGKGYDEVTGLGSYNGANLTTALG
jgi:kumamolisin